MGMMQKLKLQMQLASTTEKSDKMHFFTPKYFQLLETLSPLL